MLARGPKIKNIDGSVSKNAVALYINILMTSCYKSLDTKPSILFED